MKYVYICEFNGTPECVKCMLSDDDGVHRNCMALGSRPRCPEEGCREDCPLRFHEEEKWCAFHGLKGGIELKSIFVGKEATIIDGDCAGITGMVVGANSLENTVEIRVEPGTYITTTYERVYQA